MARVRYLRASPSWATQPSAGLVFGKEDTSYKAWFSSMSAIENYLESMHS